MAKSLTSMLWTWMLEVFIDEVRTGKREESVVSGDSLSMNGKEAWRQLRKELQSVGISHEAFSQNRGFIMTALKKAIMDEELGGDITLKFQDMDDLRQEEEIQGQFQNSVDQVSQNRNPKSALPAWVKRPSWMPTFIYKAIDRANDFTTEDLNMGNQSQREEMDDKGGKALGEAARKGHESVVQSLIERGADVNWVDRDDDNDLTALHKAAENGHDGVVRVLLANGADVRPLDFWNDTALHKAARNDHVKIVKVLLKNGAKKDLKARMVAEGQASRLLDDLN